MYESIVKTMEGACFLQVNTSAGHCCKIQLINDTIANIKYCFSSELSPHASYAVIASTEENHYTYMQDEQILLPAVSITITQTENEIRLCGKKLTIVISKDPFAIAVYNQDGVLLHHDIEGRAYYQDDNQRHNHYFALGDYTHYYGFGEKSGALNKAKRRLRMYCCDTLGYDSEKTDPLYKHIPFFIKHDPKHKISCGMFYDSSSNSILDIGCERSGYWPAYAYLSADEGDINYYIIAGDSMKEIVRGYTLLTGTTRMPTYQSLGYMASTMYYTEQEKDCDKGVEKFIQELERQSFPCDGFHLSSGYTTHEGKRCVFRWNKERFPNPERFFAWMTEKGILTSPNIKPALLTEHPLYETFAHENAFLMDKNTGSPYLERYWGGKASFIDFTSKHGRDMWKTHLISALLQKGATALWDDNNEYEINASSAMAHNEGNAIPAYQLKPVFANLMAKTGMQAVQEFDPNMRPYLLSRAGFAGIQRYAQTWAGDNFTSWNNLKYNIPVMLGMGLSGVANQGCDVGGFMGPSPDYELFVRWVQNGIFQPRFCIHSCNTDNTVTQPWNYGKHTKHVLAAMQLRYQLGLYLYSCFRQSNQQGDPIMRAMIYEFEEDNQLLENSFDFMFGPFLLIANVLEQGVTQREVYLPSSCDWYDWETGKRYAGGTTILVDAPLGKIPMFYRSGTILPLLPPSQRMQIQNTALVKLLIVADENAAFTLYQDDGQTNAYQNGTFVETTISTTVQAESICVAFEKSSHTYRVTDRYEIEMLGRTQGPMAIYQNDISIPLCLDLHEYEQLTQACYFDLSDYHLHIKLDNPTEDFTVRVDYNLVDLIGM